MTSTCSTGDSPLDGAERAIDHLRDIAGELHRLGREREGGPTLVGVLAPLPGQAPNLELCTLSGTDPLEQLLGLVAPGRWRAVGLDTGGRARSFDDSANTVEGRLVHLVDRRGTTLSTWFSGEGERFELAAGDDVVEGRAADACRRALSLPTAPPPADTTTFVVDVWLGRVIEAADDRPDLTWNDVVHLHPAATPPCTPARLAMVTAELGRTITWNSIRRAFVDDEITGYADIDSCIAEWMDDGMLARWFLGWALPWPSLIELVHARVPARVADLVVATVHLCPPTPWPSPGSSA